MKTINWNISPYLFIDDVRYSVDKDLDLAIDTDTVTDINNVLGHAGWSQEEHVMANSWST